MRLNVGVLAIEQFFRAIDRELLDHVDKLATAVITLAGIAFRILIRKNAALRLEHRAAHNVFGRDELEFVALAIELAFDCRKHLGINLFQFVHQIHS